MSQEKGRLRKGKRGKIKKEEHGCVDEGTTHAAHLGATSAT